LPFRSFTSDRFGVHRWTTVPPYSTKAAVPFYTALRAFALRRARGALRGLVSTVEIRSA
jgi:hypothetical protein